MGDDTHIAPELEETLDWLTKMVLPWMREGRKCKVTLHIDGPNVVGAVELTNIQVSKSKRYQPIS